MGATGGSAGDSHHHQSLRIGSPKSASEVREVGGPMMCSMAEGGFSHATRPAAFRQKTASSTALATAPLRMAVRVEAALLARVSGAQSQWEVRKGMGWGYH